uniref:hypothetical protein n=1 Tax=Prevotella sp. TaxID=59823 RepID=UPI003FEEEE2D
AQALINNVKYSVAELRYKKITTGIQASTADKKQQAKVLGIYDLTGRRVSDMNAGGIYIVRTNQGNFKVKK